MNKKIDINNLYIDINGLVYKVSYYDPEVKCKLGYAYIIGNTVLPYFETDKLNKKLIGIQSVNGEVSILKPISEEKRLLYDIKKAYYVTANTIAEMIETEGVKATGDLDVLLADSDDVFNPPISEKDNPLQVIIKKALNNKQIDIKNYISRFDGPSDLNNHRRSIITHGKMSFEKFIKWCDVLDLGFSIQVYDKDNSIKPMNEVITYDRD